MFRRAAVLVAIFVAALIARSAFAAPSVGAPVNTLKQAGHQGEPSIAVNPLNPNQLFMASVYVDAIGTGGGTGGGLPVASSVDGGATWTPYTIGTGTDGFVAACCDPSVSWDAFGNLFLVYLGKPGPGFQAVEVLRSATGAAASWTLLGDLESTVPNDQPTIATGAGAVWVTWNQAGSIVARGAAVSGLGVVGSFSAAQAAPGSDVVGGMFGDIAVGASGQVAVTYQDATTLYVNVDPDGTGPAGFGAQHLISSTGVSQFYSIPAQSKRLIDAEVALAYDRSGSAHAGRLYAMYTDVGTGGFADTNIMLRYSDDEGTTWSAALRVNDDTTATSQFLPRLAVDDGTGDVGISWYDARNVPANDAAQVYATFSSDGGASVLPNVQVTSGVSKMTTGAGLPVNPFQFGDYGASTFQSGTLYVAWADNSNSTGNNPNGAGSLADIYFAPVSLAAAPPSADLSVDKSASAATYKPNGTVVFRVSVTNNGPSTATAAVLTDHLPDLKQAIYLSDTGGCVSSATATLTCNLGDLAPGGTVAIDVSIRVKGSRGIVTNSATLSSTTPDPDASNNTGSVSVTIAGKP